MEKRAAVIKTPALLRGSFNAIELGVAGFDVLLWSGGKDSFLAARALCRENPCRRRQLVLLTTFEATSRQVAHQEVAIDVICRQAECLGLPLVGCPLWPHAAYAERVAGALRTIQSNVAAPLMRVCTGDLHLEHIVQWRETHLGPLISEIGARLHYPLWKVPYDVLVRDLDASGTPCRVCASSTDDVRVGELFDADFRSRLKLKTDHFGENGEFHTLCEVWDATVDDPLCSSLCS
jgi:ATP-binding cassette subfamily B (MDR/TAP) protein 1